MVSLALSPWTGVLCSLVVAWLLYRIFVGIHGPLAHLPGPWWTKFTAAQVTYFIVRKRRIYHLRALHRQYGPIVRISPTEVSVADPAAAKVIFRSAGGGFKKSSFYDHIFAMSVPNVFITRDVSYHTKWRKLLAGPLFGSSLKRLEPVVHDKVALMVSQMRNEKELQGYINIHKWMYCFTADVIGELTFGRPFGVLERGEDNDYVKATRLFLPLSIMCGVLTSRPYSETLKWPLYPFRALKKVLTHLDTAATECLQQYQEVVAKQANPPPMLFDKVLGAEGEKLGATEAEVISNAQIYIMAGTDTTGVSLIYLLWAIFGRPEALARLSQEIEDANVPEKPSNEDLRKLTYLENAITETLRVYSPVPGALPREVPEGGRNLCGHYIPEGLTVSPVAYCVHRDEELFPDPDTWNPDRWANASKEMHDAILCFGGGSRICIGMELAKMEIRMATVAVVRAFGDAKLAYGVNGFKPEDMVQVDSITAKPKEEHMLIR